MAVDVRDFKMGHYQWYCKSNPSTYFLNQSRVDHFFNNKTMSTSFQL